MPYLVSPFGSMRRHANPRGDLGRGSLAGRALVALLACCAAALAGAQGAQAACGDVNGSGAFDADDLVDYQTWLADPPPNPWSPGMPAQCTVHGRARPCDIVNAIVMARNLEGTGLGPPIGNGCEDGDQDGVDDDADLCPETPRGVAPIDTVPGCSSLDMVSRPDSLTDPAAEGLAEGARLLSAPEFVSHPAIVSLRDTTLLTSGEATLAVADMRAGNLCTAAGTYRSALDTLTAERAAVAAAYSDLVLDLELAGPLPPADHFGDGMLAVAAFDIALVELDRGIGTAEAAAEAFDRTCADVEGTLAISGHVADIDDALGVMILEEGPVVALLPGAISDPIAMGGFVDVGGTDLGSASGFDIGVATTVNCDDCVEPNPGTLQPGCLQLQLAPVQAFAPYSQTPVTWHRLTSYEGHTPSGDLELEQGMRLLVHQGGCDGFASQTLKPRYSMRVTLGSQLVANDLTPLDGPVNLPPNAPLETPLTLTYVIRRQLCVGPGNCFSYSEISDPVSVDVELNERGSLCDSVHATAEFDMEDNDPNEIRLQYITGFSHDTAAIQLSDNPYFSAQTCAAVQSAPWCSGGQIIDTHQNNSFLIFNDDFYPLYGAANLLQRHLFWRKYGVRVAAGMSWPGVQGMRNSSTYRYSCDIQPIVRDVVNFCAAPESSFYRYPLHPGGVGDPDNWEVSNGNFPGHDGLQNYAWDITASYDSQIRATRGGRVTLLKESSTPFSNTKVGLIDSFTCGERLRDCHLTAGGGSCTENSDCFATLCRYGTCISPAGSNACKADYPCDNGNYAYVRHQDGSYATYWHMRQNGVTPTKDQILHRSDEIGFVGDTGNSTENHLHYHVQSTNGVDTSASIRSRFQAHIGEAPNNFCQIPLVNDRLRSSNDPVDFY